MTEKVKSVPEEPASLRCLKALQKLDESEFRLWSFHEERAERLGDRLWTIGTWLIAFVAAALSAPFAAKFVVHANEFPYIKAKSPIPTALVSIFGLLLCGYAYAALQDVREHIEGNWRKAGFLLEGTCRRNWEIGGRKRGQQLL